MEENYNRLAAARLPRPARSAVSNSSPRSTGIASRNRPGVVSWRGCSGAMIPASIRVFDPREDMPVIDDSFARRSGAEPVCVRTCDGYFFPLFARGASNGGS